jgi:integrase
MPKHTKYPFLHHEKTRHGKFVWYFRKPGEPRIRLPNDYGSDGFWEDYHAAYSGNPTPARNDLKEYTFAWLVQEYMQSSRWKSLAKSTQEMRRRILEGMLATAKGDIRAVTKSHIQKGLDARAKTPHAANNYLKTMRQMFAWAVERDFLEENVVAKVKKLPDETDGHHVWTVEEVKRFQKKWGLGTRERVAMDLLLYTGLRRADAVLVGPKDIEDELLVLKTKKTGTPVYIPILPVLRATLDAGPIGETFIAGERGRARVSEGFGTWFAIACKAAKVPGRAHGLRKAGATLAAENGATPHELSALFGWTNTRMAEIYTREADRKKLARSAMDKMGARTGVKSADNDIEK